MKRDLSRGPSASRVCSDHEVIQQEKSRSDHETPIENLDSDANGSLKTLFERVKNTLTPPVSTPPTTNNKTTTRRSSITTHSEKTSHSHRLKQQKSVSFAEVNPKKVVDNARETDRNSNQAEEELVHTAYSFADQILLDTYDEANMTQLDDNQQFRQEFYQAIKPRRMSIGHCKDLVYQDLSAEIVAYVLKHALRSLELEDQQCEDEDDIIDLK